MIRWKIYYASGFIRSYRVGLPKSMENHFKVQAILQEKGDINNNLQILRGHDCYVLDISGYWIPIDRDSVLERLMFHRDETLCVVKGFAIPLPQFQRIYDQAAEDKRTENLD